MCSKFVTCLLLTSGLLAADTGQQLWQQSAKLFEAGEYASAKQPLTFLIALDPKQGAPWALLGMCDYELHDFPNAVSHIERGLAFGIPDSLDLTTPALQDYALALLQLGDFERAHTVITGTSNRAGMDSDFWLIADGLTILQKPGTPDALDWKPDWIAAAKEIGRLDIQLYKRELQNPREHWKTLVAQHPDVPGIHHAFAKLLLNLPDNAAAEKEFRAELSNYPDNIAAKLGLAFTLMQEDQLESAAKLVNEAITADPTSANAHYLLGTILARQQRWDESRIQLEASEKLDSGLSRVHYSLSQVYAKLHRPADSERERAAYERLQANEESFNASGHRQPSELQDDPQLLLAEAKKYVEGDGVTRDPAKGFALYKNAAEQNSVQGEFMTGTMYAQGLGTDQNYAEAAKWFQRAAGQGDPASALNLALLYGRGTGVLQDYAQAVKWYRFAAEHGVMEAAKPLAWHYSEGIGVPRDDVEAAKWWRIAAEQGDPSSEFSYAKRLATGQGVPRDTKAAAEWFRKAADRGQAEAQYGLAMLMLNGDGITKDVDGSVKLLREAATQNDLLAAMELARLFYEGAAVPRDLDEAYRYARQAAAKKNPESVHLLDQIKQARNPRPAS